MRDHDTSHRNSFNPHDMGLTVTITCKRCFRYARARYIVPVEGSDPGFSESVTIRLNRQLRKDVPDCDEAVLENEVRRVLES